MDGGWHTVVDGRICDVQGGEIPVGEADWIRHPLNWGGSPGDKVEWFDGSWFRISDTDLVLQGKRINNKGRVYNIHDGSPRDIYDYDEELAENETKEVPPDNPFRKFDQQTRHWIIDTIEEAKAEKQSAIAQIEAEISRIETEQLRALREIYLGIPPDPGEPDPDETVRRVQSEIASLRINWKTLDAELKDISAA